MTKREQLIECAEAMESGMLNIQYKRDIWQNELIYWICKAIKLLIEVQLKNLKDQTKQKEKLKNELKQIIFGKQKIKFAHYVMWMNK